MNVFTANQEKVIIIGRQYENDVTKIQFPIRRWREMFGGNGRFFLSVMRCKDRAPYEVVIEETEDYVLWTPTAADTKYKGYGEAQLTYRINGKVAKTEVFQIFTDRSLPQTDETPPEWEGFVERVEAAALSAFDSSESAEQSKNSAQIAQEAAEDAAEEARAQADYAAGIMGLASFHIDISTGELIVVYPTPYYGAVFSINDNGYLEVTV